MNGLHNSWWCFGPASIVCAHPVGVPACTTEKKCCSLGSSCSCLFLYCATYEFIKAIAAIKKSSQVLNYFLHTNLLSCIGHVNFHAKVCKTSFDLFTLQVTAHMFSIGNKIFFVREEDKAGLVYVCRPMMIEL